MKRNSNVGAAGTAGANKQMVFDEIEKLKQEYTDKYVVIEGGRPELARFKGATGRIKTVNMSGRALVEFDANNNIGWYDIALDFLKVVDQPLPKPAAEAHEKPAKKEAPAKPKAAPAPAGEKKLSPLEMARAQGAAKKPGEAPKKSTADILAAARGGKAAAPAKAEAAPAAQASAPAAKPAAAAPTGKLSTADILAAARAKKGEAPAAPAKPAAPAAVEEAPSAPPAVAEPEPAPVVAAEKPAPSKSNGAKLGSTAEKIAWCRQHDAK